MKHYQSFVVLLITFISLISTTTGKHSKHFDPKDPKLVALLESTRLQIWARNRTLFPATVDHIWNINLVVRKTNSNNIFGYYAQLATVQSSPGLVNCSIWVQPSYLEHNKVNQLAELICQ